MADSLLLPALKSQPRVLNFSNKKLEKVPKAIGKLEFVVKIELKNNFLKKLPQEFGHLHQLESLNLGNNKFEDLPGALQSCIGLQTLHIFQNCLSKLSPDVLLGLKNLKFLNLNNNQLKSLPPEIGRLRSLQFLSVDHNELSYLPVEICACSELTEFHVAYNKLETLPLEFGFLFNLEKLYLHKNRLKELPESMGKCYKLRVMDVAANDLRIFPTEFGQLPMKELYCEENPLLAMVPVHSVQEEEVLSLKEITARYIMKELKDRWSNMRKSIRHYPEIRDLLSQSSKCAVCGETFLNTWLECVRFVEAQKILKATNSIGTIPIRALLCSYKCFNAPGHEYYGVAFP